MAFGVYGIAARTRLLEIKSEMRSFQQTNIDNNQVTLTTYILNSTLYIYNYFAIIMLLFLQVIRYL